jgi:GDP-4-dehydro-6-deoxy-D-mannose reductase
MYKILFLGSNSFTGYHFKNFINNNGLHKEFNFVGVDRNDEDNSKSSNIEYLKINALNEDELENVLTRLKPDYIINFIGTFYGDSYEEYININTNITRNIFKLIVKNNLIVKKVLVIGSAAEYGKVCELPVKENSVSDPVSFYGLSKLMQTYVSKYYYNNHGINMNVARTFNIIGKGISNKLSVGNFIDQIGKAKEGDSIKVGNLNAKRDYLFISDVIEAYWEILINGRSGEIYNVCFSKSYSMEDILNTLITSSGKLINTRIDKTLVKSNDISDIFGDNSKLMSHTAWYPKKDIMLDDKLYQLIC